MTMDTKLLLFHFKTNRSYTYIVVPVKNCYFNYCIFFMVEFQQNITKKKKNSYICLQ